MFGFGMESVYVGRSMRDFSAVREALSSRGIDYKYKVNNRQAAWLFPAGGTVRSPTGSLGMDSDSAHEYEVFVKRDRAVEARYHIMNALRNA